MDDTTKVQHLIEVAERAALTVSDQTTAQRFLAFAQDLRQKLQNWQVARRLKQETRARAYELWDQAGRPSGRDEEFWLTAERNLKEENEPQSPAR